ALRTGCSSRCRKGSPFTSGISGFAGRDCLVSVGALSTVGAQVQVSNRAILASLVEISGVLPLLRRAPVTSIRESSPRRRAAYPCRRRFHRQRRRLAIRTYRAPPTAACSRAACP